MFFGVKSKIRKSTIAALLLASIFLRSNFLVIFDLTTFVSPSKRLTAPLSQRHATGEWEQELQRFWETPLGVVRQQFEAMQVVRLKPGRQQLSPAVDVAQVVPHQVMRDIEQFEYLLENNIVNDNLRQYIEQRAIPEYRNILDFAQIQFEKNKRQQYPLVEYKSEFRSFFSLYKKTLYLDRGDALTGEALGYHNWESLQNDYLNKQHRSLVIDNFLSQEALLKLRTLLLDSTFWLDSKSGYVGTYLHTGFSCPLVAQIDHEIRSKLPQILEGLELQNAWSFMFDGSLGGVNTHADDAQVQINIFLTHTEANLWSENSAEPRGGLIIFGIGPPDNWPFTDFNSEGAHPAIDDLIASTGNWNLTVPYVQNRAIMFDSTYFHRTDEMKFKSGYKNRRINVTFLYGKRSKLVQAHTIRAEEAHSR